jgi:GPH family glycoside/pentoside/hexuronide:cation symporter
MLSLLLKRYEKHHLWTFAMLSLGVILAAQIALYPGMPGMLVVLVGVSLLIYGLVAGAVMVPLALMGDLADYEAWRSGNRAAGPLVAIMQLGYKLAGGAASASALYAVSLFGFQPGQPTYDSTASFGIEAINLALPAALVFMAAAIAWRYPITQRRHKAILRALERRSGRQARLP